MNVVQRLFGVDASEIKEDVILTPFLNASYFTDSATPKKAKGFLFEVLTHKQFSVIKTGVGASFVGDAIMYLQETPCKRLYFVGSCASLVPYEVGDIVVAQKALACESFSEIVEEHIDTRSFIIPEHNLSDAFFTLYRLAFEKRHHTHQVKAASIATLGSLSLQKKLAGFLRQYGVGCVDMELAAFFSAANSVHLPCLGLLYVTDDIEKKPFYRDLSAEERKTIKTARQQTIALLCEYIKHQNA